MKLDERDILILEYLEREPGSLRPLLQTVAKSSAYARLKKMKAAGYVTKVGGEWRLTPLGREALEAARSGSSPARPGPDIVEAVPHLALAPTPVHRAILTLIVAAIIARSHRLSGSHHATFMLVGSKLTWKTWVLKMACLIAGVDPAKYVLNMAAETPGSLIQRRKATGEVLTKRLAIEQPVMGVDELGRARPGVLGISKVVFSGDIETPFENDILEIRCVPVVTMNPRTDRDDADLTEILGLDEGTIRRSVVAALRSGAIPENILTEGDARLDRARALGAADLPAPRHPEWLPLAEVQHCVQAALNSPERSADIDFTLVAQLCAALTAYLSRSAALYLGIKCYLEIVETLGWLKPNWRDALPPVSDLEDASAEDACSVPATVAPSRPNALDYTESTHTMLATCKRLGVSAEEGAELLSRVEALGIERLTALESFDSRLTAAGIPLEELEETSAAAQALAVVTGAPPDEATGVMRGVVQTVLRAFPDDLAKGELLSAIQAVISKAADAGQLEELIKTRNAKLGELDQRIGEAVASRAEEEENLRETGFRRKEAGRELDETENLLASRGEMLADLNADCDERAADLTLANEVIRLLTGELTVDGPLAQRLGWALAARRKKKLKARVVCLSFEVRRELYELFLRKVDPDLVPKWWLEQWQRNTRSEQARLLRQELESTKDCLGDPNKNFAEKQSAIKAAIAHLLVREFLPL